MTTLMHPLLRQNRTLLSFSITALAASMSTSGTGATSKPPSEPSTGTQPPPWPTRSYTPTHTKWPYHPSDFRRADPTPDTDFYSAPRFVTHIDDNAISLLKTYYAHVLPRKGRILDFCSSWISHFPPELESLATPSPNSDTQKSATETETGLQVIGLGLSTPELAANPILHTRITQDLNVHPSINLQLPPSLTPLHAATCVVSIDYLTCPVAVLSSLRQSMVEGGKVHLVLSNRCFPTKAVARWLRVGEDERCEMVGDYLWWSGWREVEVVTLCDGTGKGGGWFGFGRTDPLWVVRATNTGVVVDGEGQGDAGPKGKRDEL